MSADINQIAKACSVSKATVSRVFNNKPGVSDTLRQKILETARRMNYSPKQVMAQDTVAIVVGDFDVFYNPGRFQAHLVAAVIARLSQSGYALKVVLADEVERLATGYVKVAAVFVEYSQLPDVARRLAKLNIQVITGNMQCEGVSSVSVDAAQGCKLAVSHFVACGHKKIAMLLDSQTSWASLERVRGYREAMLENSLSEGDEGIFDIGKGGEVIVERLAAIRRGGYTALFIAGEGIVEEASYMLNLLDVKIPQDLSVISCEKIPTSRWLTPPHTTVEQNLDQISEQVVELTGYLFGGIGVQNFDIMLEAKLIERESVRSL